MRLLLTLDEGSDCRFVETAADTISHRGEISTEASVYVSLYPIPLGFGVAVDFGRHFGWEWFHRTGRY